MEKVGPSRVGIHLRHSVHLRRDPTPPHCGPESDTGRVTDPGLRVVSGKTTPDPGRGGPRRPSRRECVNPVITRRDPSRETRGLFNETNTLTVNKGRKMRKEDKPTVKGEFGRLCPKVVLVAWGGVGRRCLPHAYGVEEECWDTWVPIRQRNSLL